jgi:hypothetical protein
MDKASSSFIALLILFFFAIIGAYLYIYFQAQQFPTTNDIIIGPTGVQGSQGNQGVSGSYSNTGARGPTGAMGAINPIQRLSFISNGTPNEFNQLFFWDTTDNESITIFAAHIEDDIGYNIPIQVMYSCTRSVNISLRQGNSNWTISTDFLQVPSTKSVAVPNAAWSSNYCGFDYRLIRPTVSIYGEASNLPLTAGYYYILLYVITDELIHYSENRYNGYILDPTNATLVRPGGQFSFYYYNPYPTIYSITIYGNSTSLLALKSVEAFDVQGQVVSLSSPEYSVTQTSTYQNNTTQYGPRNAIITTTSGISVLGTVGVHQSWSIHFLDYLPLDIKTLRIVHGSSSGIPVTTLRGCRIVVQNVQNQVVFEDIMTSDSIQTFVVWPFFNG